MILFKKTKKDEKVSLDREIKKIVEKLGLATGYNLAKVHEYVGDENTTLKIIRSINNYAVETAKYISEGLVNITGYKKSKDVFERVAELLSDENVISSLNELYQYYKTHKKESIVSDIVSISAFCSNDSVKKLMREIKKYRAEISTSVTENLIYVGEKVDTIENSVDLLFSEDVISSLNKLYEDYKDYYVVQSVVRIIAFSNNKNIFEKAIDVIRKYKTDAVTGVALVLQDLFEYTKNKDDIEKAMELLSDERTIHTLNEVYEKENRIFDVYDKAKELLSLNLK
ncbi:MAG: hypothetical protein RMJ17_00810 [Candidatus Aenigmarchaeota archaeon]|nr:hypothetical protein [Candidatus Aenigmarchaeota archaeon]MDW8149126.1 hypothetical protein [Candidatus Aenigmarchaeota archaeon]